MRVVIAEHPSLHVLMRRTRSFPTSVAVCTLVLVVGRSRDESGLGGAVVKSLSISTTEVRGLALRW